jgi:hypothetical protein
MTEAPTPTTKLYSLSGKLFLDYNWNGKQLAPWLVSARVSSKVIGAVGS